MAGERTTPEERAATRTLFRHVKAAFETTSVRGITRPLGWAETDRERRFYDWEKGKAVPEFRNTLMLLALAGFLRTERSEVRDVLDSLGLAVDGVPSPNADDAEVRLRRFHRAAEADQFREGTG